MKLIVTFTHSLPSDMNECALNQDACLVGQYCENTIGSYTCRRSISCGTGYTLDRTTQQCIGIVSVLVIKHKNNIVQHHPFKIVLTIFKIPIIYTYNFILSYELPILISIHDNICLLQMMMSVSWELTIVVGHTSAVIHQGHSDVLLNDVLIVLD